MVVAALSAAFVIVLIAAEVQSTRNSVREEIEAANRVASQLLGRLAAVYSQVGGPDLVLQFLQQLGRVRANEVSLQSATGEVLYQAPPATYKAGREAPVWFAHLLGPQPAKYTFPLRGGVLLVVEAQPSRAVLDAWDDVTRLVGVAAAMFIVVNGLAFWSVKRALEPSAVEPVRVEQKARHPRLMEELLPASGESAADALQPVGNHCFHRRAAIIKKGGDRSLLPSHLICNPLAGT